MKKKFLGHFRLETKHLSKWVKGSFNTVKMFGVISETLTVQNYGGVKVSTQFCSMKTRLH